MQITKKYNLDVMRKEWLSIYDEIAKICDRHGLVYYVSDGTLLGAIRHKGFIPWDDDLDMSMPRPDYEKFKEYARAELPSHLKFLDWTNTKEFTLLFGKVHDTREEHIREIERKAGYELSSGLFVDIFPIDGYPESKLARLILGSRAFVLRAIARFRFGKYCRESAKGRWVWRLGCVLSFLCPWLKSQKDILKKLEVLTMSYSYDASHLVGRTCSDASVLRRPPVEKDIWSSKAVLPFEERSISVPIGWDLCLRNEYGDNYMQMPPAEKQVFSHVFNGREPWWMGPTENC